MKKIVLVTIWTSLLLVDAAGQDHPYTFNIGGGPGFPVGDISDFSDVGGNFVAGAGVNLVPRFGFDGEFMWHGLPPGFEALRRGTAGVIGRGLPPSRLQMRSHGTRPVAQA